MSLKNFFSKSSRFWQKRKIEESHNIKFNFIAALISFLFVIFLWHYNILLAFIAMYFVGHFVVCLFFALPLYIEAKLHAKGKDA